MEKITFCIPSKNNCRYLKACIPSIRKNSYRKDHDIIVFVDEDTDGTTEWLESVKDKYNIRYTVNDTGGLYGIGRAYDKCIEESETDIFMIFPHKTINIIRGYFNIFNFFALIKLIFTLKIKFIGF